MAILHKYNSEVSTFINQKYLDIFDDPDQTKVLAQEILDKGYVLLPQFLSEDIFAQLKALGQSRTIINKKQRIEGRSRP